MKKHLFILIFLGIFFALPSKILAQGNEVIIEFEKAPLFKESNFLPNDSVTRWVKVTNNSSEPKKIGTEAINVFDPDNFGQALILEIKENSQTFYKDSLANFFKAGEISLSEVAPGTTTFYYFTVTFDKNASNEFQDKSLGFDLLVGILGEEGISDSDGGTGGGQGTFRGGMGGAVSMPGLVIKNEEVIEVSTSSAVIKWLTSYKATSRVIYASENESHQLDLSDNQGDLPKYGYAHTTPEFNSPASINGTTTHLVVLEGLRPNTTYYYRCISHASPPTISKEFSFKTLPLEKEGLKKPSKKESETGLELLALKKKEAETKRSPQAKKEASSKELAFKEEKSTKKESLESKKTPKEKPAAFQKEPSEKEKSNPLLAFLKGLGANFGWLIILIIIFGVGIGVYLLNRRRT